MSNTQVLPSEQVQKEFERNPLKLLEEIKIEENSSQSFEEEKNESEIIRNSGTNSPESDDISIYKTNLNCTNDLINYSPNITSIDKRNIFLDNFNIGNNFEGKEDCKSDEDISVNNDINNTNNLIQNVFINVQENSNYVHPCNDNNLNNSSLLEKNNKNNNINLVKTINNAYHLNISKLLSNLKTYKGSLYAQSLLECINTEKELSSFFNDIIPNICEIMCSEYGNYFFQKLIKKLTLEQKLKIYRIINPEFLAIATNKWGTHSIQSLINNIQSPNELYELNLLISKNMYLLFTNNNAYHIMMKMILDFQEDKRNVVNIFLVTNIDKIIINNNGAFCINKFIVNNRNLKLRKLLLENLKKNIKKLIFNKYSCINLLLIIQTFGIEWGIFILKEIQENFISLLDNPVSRVFVMKVFEFLKNNNMILLRDLLWPLYRNIAVINYIVANKSQKKFLKQLIELSDDEQKIYLYILLKRSNW